MLASLFFRVLLLSLAGGVCIGVLFLFRVVTKKICSQKWHYYIWVLPLIILLVPFQLPVLTLPVNEVFEPVYELASDSYNGSVFDSSWKETDGINEPGDMPQNDAASDGDFLPGAVGQGRQEQAGWFRSFLYYVPYIWLIVFLGLLIYKTYSYRRFTEFLKKTATQFNMENTPHGLLQNFMDFKVCTIRTPFLLGLFRQIIYLPDIQWTPEELEMTLTHEIVHSQRKDLQYKFMMQFVVCLHWFNPMVHWMNRDMQKYCELSCDEAVTLRMNREKQKVYMKTIVKLIEKTREIPQNYAAAMNTSPGDTERRIRAMMKQKKGIGKRYKIAVVLLTGMLLATGSFLATGFNGFVNAKGEIPSIANGPQTGAGFAHNYAGEEGGFALSEGVINGVEEAIKQIGAQIQVNQNPVELSGKNMADSLLYAEARLVEKHFDQVDQLDVKIIQQNLKISSGGDQLLVRYYQWWDEEFTLEETEGKLILRESDKYQMSLNNNSPTSDWVNTYLQSIGKNPDPEDPKATQRTVEIIIPQNWNLDQIDVKNGMAPLLLQNIQAKKAFVANGTASLRISGLTGEEIEIKNGTGATTVSNMNVTSGKLDLGTGMVAIQKGTVQNMKLLCGTGSVKLVEIKGETADIETGTGSIQLQNCDYTSYKVLSGTGSIRAEGGRGVNFQIQTETGSVYLNGVDGLSKCDMLSSTGSGYINLTGSSDQYRISLDANNNTLFVDGKAYDEKNVVNPNGDKSISMKTGTGSLSVNSYQTWSTDKSSESKK